MILLIIFILSILLIFKGILHRKYLRIADRNYDQKLKSDFKYDRETYISKEFGTLLPYFEPSILDENDKKISGIKRKIRIILYTFWSLVLLLIVVLIFTF